MGFSSPKIPDAPAAPPPPPTPAQLMPSQASKLTSSPKLGGTFLTQSMPNAPPLAKPNTFAKTAKSLLGQ